MQSKSELQTNQQNHPHAFKSSSTQKSLTCPAQADLLFAAKKAFITGNEPAKNIKVHKTRSAHSAMYSNENMKKMDALHLLGHDEKAGGTPFSVMTSFGIALLSYLAFRYTDLKKEKNLVYRCYQLLIGDISSRNISDSSPEYRLALAQGFKAEVNEIARFEELHNFIGCFEITEASLQEEIKTYTDILLEGGKRPVIDRHTPQQISSESLQRPIPAFFPLDIEKKETDRIVLMGGGCRAHFAITVIWTQPVDEQGNKILAGSNIKPARYKVYRTMCNAGFGISAVIEHSQLYQENPRLDENQRAYTLTTQEVLLPEGVEYSHAAMRGQIAKLINTEREMRIFQLAPPSSPEPTPAFLKWFELNRSVRLGPLEEQYSHKYGIQGKHNCTMRSTIEYLRWVLLENAPSDTVDDMIGDFWKFCSEKYSDLIQYDFDFIYNPKLQSNQKPKIKTRSSINPRRGKNNLDTTIKQSFQQRLQEGKTRLKKVVLSVILDNSNVQISTNQRTSVVVNAEKESNFLTMQNPSPASSAAQIINAQTQSTETMAKVKTEEVPAPTTEQQNVFPQGIEEEALIKTRNKFQSDNNDLPIKNHTTLTFEDPLKSLVIYGNENETNIDSDNEDDITSTNKTEENLLIERADSNVNFKGSQENFPLESTEDPMKEPVIKIAKTPDIIDSDNENDITSTNKTKENLLIERADSNSNFNESQENFLSESTEDPIKEPVIKIAKTTNINEENDLPHDGKQNNQKPTLENNYREEFTENQKNKLIAAMKQAIAHVSGKTRTLLQSQSIKKNSLNTKLSNYQDGDKEALKSFLVEAAKARRTLSFFNVKYYKHASFGETASATAFVNALINDKCLINFLYQELNTPAPALFDCNAFKELAQNLKKEKNDSSSKEFTL